MVFVKFKVHFETSSTGDLYFDASSYNKYT